jgi:hypothetical protein
MADWQGSRSTRVQRPDIDPGIDAQAGNIRIDLSDPILHEALPVLRDKLQMLANRVTPTEILKVIEEDPDDKRILECASAARPISSSAKTRTCCGADNLERRGSSLIRDFVKLALTAGPTSQSLTPVVPPY